MPGPVTMTVVVGATTTGWLLVGEKVEGPSTDALLGDGDNLRSDTEILSGMVV